MKKKLSKDERLALIRAGREDRGKYVARAAVKQKKVMLHLLTMLSGILSFFLF